MNNSSCPQPKYIESDTVYHLGKKGTVTDNYFDIPLGQWRYFIDFENEENLHDLYEPRFSEQSLSDKPPLSDKELDYILDMADYVVMALNRNELVKEATQVEDSQ